MPDVNSTATEHLSMETVAAMARALRQAETLFRALDAFDIPEGELFDVGESIRSLPADAIFYALTERGMALTRGALSAIEPTAGETLAKGPGHE